MTMFYGFPDMVLVSWWGKPGEKLVSVSLNNCWNHSGQQPTTLTRWSHGTSWDSQAAVWSLPPQGPGTKGKTRVISGGHRLHCISLNGHIYYARKTSNLCEPRSVIIPSQPTISVSYARTLTSIPCTSLHLLCRASRVEIDTMSFWGFMDLSWGTQWKLNNLWGNILKRLTQGRGK